MSRSPTRSLAVRATSSALALCVIGSAAQADPGTPAYPEGAAAFAANCSVCHGAKGTGTPSLAPPLTSYPARYAADPEGRRQLSNTVLAGLFGDVTVEGKHYDFKMPDFSRLDDRTIAAVLNYVVFDLGQAQQGTQPLTTDEVATERPRAIAGAELRKRREALLQRLGL